MDAVIGQNDGRGEHRYSFTGSTFNMHCKGTNGEGGYQRVDHLNVGEKRSKPNSACGSPAVASQQLSFGPNQIPLNRADVVRGCTDPTLHKDAAVIVTLDLVQNGRTVETAHITDHGSGSLFDGKLTYDLDQQGLLKMRMRLFCPMQQ
jgi:hypothetical protein